jgi:hypothetical protein
MNVPNDDDIMLSQPFLSGREANIVLLDLFADHGRQPFSPDPDAYHAKRPELGRRYRARFNRAITVLIADGYIKQLPDGRCKIVTNLLMTGREYKRCYPNAAYGNSISWPHSPAETD